MPKLRFCGGSGDCIFLVGLLANYTPEQDHHIRLRAGPSEMIVGERRVGVGFLGIAFPHTKCVVSRGKQVVDHSVHGGVVFWPRWSGGSDLAARAVLWWSLAAVYCWRSCRGGFSLAIRQRRFSAGDPVGDLAAVVCSNGSG